MTVLRTAVVVEIAKKVVAGNNQKPDCLVGRSSYDALEPYVVSCRKTNLSEVGLNRYSLYMTSSNPPELCPTATRAPVPKVRETVAPKWEQSAKVRILSGLKKIGKPTLMLKEKDAAEADTRHLVTDILVDLLGFDKYENLTAEFAVRGDWADYGIRIEKQLEAFVEVKRISQKLSSTHLRQVESYALKEGVQWAILTNAQVWQAYYVTPIKGQQSEVTLIFEVDLLDETTKLSQKTDLLFLISREGITKGKLEDYRSAQNAVSPKTLKPILLSDDVLATVRKEIKRKMKHNVEPKDLKQAVRRILGEE